jgi:hypothetical protein
MLVTQRKLAVVTGASTEIGLRQRMQFDPLIAANEVEIRTADQLRRESGSVEAVPYGQFLRDPNFFPVFH